MPTLHTSRLHLRPHPPGVQVVAGRNYEVVARLSCPDVDSTVGVHAEVYVPLAFRNEEPEVRPTCRCRCCCCCAAAAPPAAAGGSDAAGQPSLVPPCELTSLPATRLPLPCLPLQVTSLEIISVDDGEVAY